MAQEQQCPEACRLQALMEGGISDDEQAEVASHLKDCASCQARLEELLAQSDLLSPDAKELVFREDQPETALQRAIEQLRAAEASWQNDEQATSTGGPGSSSGEDILLDLLQPSDDPQHLGRLGPYEILEVVGHGGMGVVLKGYEDRLNRCVAIKVLNPRLASNATARKRFRRESRAAAAVTHDHVVTIHAVDEIDGLPILVMEYVEGTSLQKRINDNGPLELEEILRVGTQAAQGLAAAHAQGLIHRDVKPSNILLENGVERVKLTDFGLARAVDDVQLTQTGVVAGTPEYMSPEQAQGEAVDRRSDLFSLGCVLYAMCTGRSPFRAASTMAALRRVSDETPRRIQEVNEAIPDWLVEIIDRLLAKDREERLESTSEVAQLLGDHLAHLQHPSEVPRPPRLTKLPSTDSRQRRARFFGRRWVVAVALVLLVLTAGLGVIEGTGVTKLVSTVIELWTPKGTLVLEIYDPGIEVTVKGNGEELTISGGGVHSLTMQVGEYELIPHKDGQPYEQRLASITRGGWPVVEVFRAPPSSDERRIAPGDADWRNQSPAPAIAPFDADQAKKHQQAWADYLGVPVETDVDLGNGVKLTLVLIPPGEFVMGLTAEEAARFLKEEEKSGGRNFQWIASAVRQDRVRITRPFYLGKYEVTQAEWVTVMGNNPSQCKDPWNPVEAVSWEDTQSFCSKLNGAGLPKGMTFALPTEAQWEYACRAGTATAYSFGEDTAVLRDYAWYEENSGRRPHPVGTKKPNGWGLYDMHGNVSAG